MYEMELSAKETAPAGPAAGLSLSLLSGCLLLVLFLRMGEETVSFEDSSLRQEWESLAHLHLLADNLVGGNVFGDASGTATKSASQMMNNSVGAAAPVYAHAFALVELPVGVVAVINALGMATPDDPAEEI